MLKRCVTGAAFVAVIVGFFFLREIDVRLFNILIYAFSLLGTYEVYRALKHAENGNEAFSCGTGRAAGCIVAACTLAFVPVHTFFGGAWSVAVLGLGVVAIAALEVAAPSGAKSFGSRILALLYPDAFLFCMLAVNALPVHSLHALLLIFVTSPLADTFAYLVGSAIGGKKLCPKISPNKTVSGAVGGLVGGALGALILHFIFPSVLGMQAEWLIFLVIGLAAAFFTEAGDLFESYIKRRVGIKDMGKLLPGHGGVMDRIDGILFCSAFTAAVFALF